MNADLERALKTLRVDEAFPQPSFGPTTEEEGPPLKVRSPIDGSTLAVVVTTTIEQANWAISRAVRTFPEWRDTPAPVRGELVRRIGNAFRERQNELATLIAWEVGKILPEARGEVQEVIDICDFAVGLSRQLYGKTIASERPGHRLTEYWHPLGPMGVISAFNFPVAVWAWNAMIGLACGDPIVWKPSEKAPLSAIACQQIVERCIRDAKVLCSGLSTVVIGGREVGEAACRVAATAAHFSNRKRANGPRCRPDSRKKAWSFAA